jgi:hypothetical protein
MDLVNQFIQAMTQEDCTNPNFWDFILDSSADTTYDVSEHSNVQLDEFDFVSFDSSNEHSNSASTLFKNFYRLTIAWSFS